MDDVLDLLHRELAGLPLGTLYVGCSGGLDSSVLLHALAQLPEARVRGLFALHVDHGLQRASGEWAARCRAFATLLGIECTILTAQVEHETGLGPEAAARAARYAAFATRLPAGAILTLAHHRDDQSETILLKLLRGAGPDGLGGMRAQRPFASGLLWRPLLALPRAALRAYAQAHALAWVDDPSNAEPRFARNFLRSEIFPALRRRWPHLNESLGHAARHARAASDFIAAEAEKALAQIQGLDPATLRWRAWRDLPDALRDPALRKWLRALGLSEPTHLHVAELERQLDDAEESLLCVSFAQTQLRRYRDLLYATASLQSPPKDWQISWDGARVSLPANCGCIALIDAGDADAPLPDASLSLTFRRGGEILRALGDSHVRELRDLFQQAGVPPWQRGRIPLLRIDGALAAVGDLWLNEKAADWLERHGRRIDWHQGHAQMRD